MNRHPSLDLRSEKRNLKDCCGSPFEKTIGRGVVVRSNESILTFSRIVQTLGCCASIFTESLEESQRRPGAEKSGGFSRTGEMQTEPGPHSADGAACTRMITARIAMLIPKAILPAGFFSPLASAVRRWPADRIPRALCYPLLVTELPQRPCHSVRDLVRKFRRCDFSRRNNLGKH